MPFRNSAQTRSPARVHPRARELSDHFPCWIRRPYGGGLYSIEHFRICSYCQSIHPGDLIERLAAGEAQIEGMRRPGRYDALMANPIAGELVQMGSLPGRVFDREIWPAGLRDKLKAPPRAAMPFKASMAERLAGHFDRPCLEPAPAIIRWPLYSEHVSDEQWPEIWAIRGERNAHLQSA